MKMLTLFFAVLFLISCSTDYDGNEPVLENPTITITESGTTLVNSFVRVEWIGIIGNETDMDYYYCVTTDTLIIAQTALTALPADKWLTTKNNYADISFPMVAFNSDVVFYKDSVYQDLDSNQIEVKIAFSKIFVYAENSVGTCSPVSGRLYSRINQKPKLSFMRSDELNFNLDDEETADIFEDKLILPEANSYSEPIDFQWFGEDRDLNSKVEFKWELWENEGKTAALISSSEWGESYGVEINDEIYNNNPAGDYSFKIFIRDDALEQGDMNYTVNFSVFTPTFDKGILFLDDTDPTLYSQWSNLYMGNPNGDNTSAFYKNILEYAGFSPDSLVAGTADSLRSYVIKRFVKGTEIVRYDTTWIDDDFDPTTPDVIDQIEPIYIGVYKPTLKEIVQYRIVIFASDDRSNTKGVDWAGEPPYTGYIEIMKKYLDVGGKAFMLGNSSLMGNLYTYPDQLPINRYLEPYRQIFDSYALPVATLSSGTKDFFNKYFGIYAMTFPEQKTYINLNLDGTVAAANRQFALDKGVQADNYDFIGCSVYDQIDDPLFKPLSIDSAKVNDSWYNKQTVNNTTGALIPYLNKLSLKDNGTVFTGVPTFEAYKGEVVYKYKSIYDLPVDPANDSLVVDGDMTHDLWWKDPVTHTQGPILQRSGTVATRYIADGDQYRTAFFVIPTYFLDNSENQVNDMFKAVINWFDLENDPLDGEK